MAIQMSALKLQPSLLSADNTTDMILTFMGDNLAEVFNALQGGIATKTNQKLLKTAICYLLGMGTSIDPTKAFEIVATSSDSISNWAKGKCHEMGFNQNGNWTKSAEEAFRFYEQSYKQDKNIYAAYDLARCYLYGIGTPMNQNESLFYFSQCVPVWQKWAEQGDVISQARLGRCLESGRVVLQNEREAVELYRTAAKKGLPEAQFNFAKCFFEGIGVEKDEGIALYWLKQAAEQGDIDALVALGNHYEACQERNYAKEDYETGRQNLLEAKNWYSKAAERGDAEAQFKYAESILSTGMGGGKRTDFKAQSDALPWLEKSAQQGFLEAQLRLGSFHSRPRAVTKAINPAKAFYWYLKAAKQGSPEALYEVGWRLADGYGTPPNQIESIQYLTQAAETGSPDIQYRVGAQLKDKKQSHIWLLKAAETGSPDIQYRVGLQFGKDKTKSHKWLIKAAETGSSEIQYLVGLHLIEDKNIVQDVEQGMKWLHKAAEQGYSPALFDLGMYLEEGELISKDKVQALYFFRKAAEQGFQDALLKLEGDYREKINVKDWSLHSFRPDEADELVKEREHLRSERKLQKSADEGDAHSQYLLGEKYLNGNGIEKDEKKGRALIRKAAEGGSEFAQRHLAIRLLKGYSIDKNLQEAAYWFQKLADQHDLEGQFGVGLCYLQGIGVNKDLNKGALYLIKAAEQIMDVALLGLYYVNKADSETEKRRKKAVEAKLAETQFKANAEEGRAGFQCRLGLSYLTGRGVLQDEKTGIDWLKKAAAQGQRDSQLYLGLCYGLGKGVRYNQSLATYWLDMALQDGEESFEKFELCKLDLRSV